MIEIPNYKKYNIRIDYLKYYKKFNLKTNIDVDNLLILAYGINKNEYMIDLIRFYEAKTKPITKEDYEKLVESYNKELTQIIGIVKSYREFVKGLTDITKKSYEESILMLIHKDTTRVEYYKGDCMDVCINKDLIENNKIIERYQCICGWCNLPVGLKRLCIFKLEGEELDLIFGYRCNENLKHYINLETNITIKEKLKKLYKTHKEKKKLINKKVCHVCEKKTLNITDDADICNPCSINRLIKRCDIKTPYIIKEPIFKPLNMKCIGDNCIKEIPIHKYKKRCIQCYSKQQKSNQHKNINSCIDCKKKCMYSRCYSCYSKDKDKHIVSYSF
tara:strand:+ start:773 stop:1768 length:996 start_codon:yes stop_codon:yes gene_type:complete